MFSQIRLSQGKILLVCVPWELSSACVQGALARLAYFSGCLCRPPVLHRRLWTPGILLNDFLPGSHSWRRWFNHRTGKRLEEKCVQFDGYSLREAFAMLPELSPGENVCLWRHQIVGRYLRVEYTLIDEFHGTTRQDDSAFKYQSCRLFMVVWGTL